MALADYVKFASEKNDFLTVEVGKGPFFGKEEAELKRKYLALFWEKIVVKDRKIVEAVPTLLFRSVAPQQEKAGDMPTPSSVRNFIGWLADWNTFCTGAWINELEFPKTTVEQARKIVAIAATAPGR